MKHRILALIALIAATLLVGGLAPVNAVQPDGQALGRAGAEMHTLPLDRRPPQPIALMATIPTAITPDPLVQEMIDRVDSTTVMSYTGDLSGEWAVVIEGEPYTITTRNTYSGTPIDKATRYVGEHLASLGLDVEYHNWSAGGTSGRNVIGEFPGEIHPEDVFIIGAHLDDLPSSGVAPGADDNASGSAAVLVAADILSQYRWGCTLRFALWTGEEQGMLGSRAYATRAAATGEAIVGVLNMDMIAWNTPGSEAGIDLYANPYLLATVDLANLFANVTDVYDLNLIPEVNANGFGYSDHVSFWDQGYTAILAIEDLSDFSPYRHQVTDTSSHLDRDFFTEFVKASVGTLAHMSHCAIRSLYVPLVMRDAASQPTR
jgi:Peptidase family M28